MAEIGDVLPYGSDHEITMTEYTDTFSVGTVALEGGDITTLMENTVSTTRIMVDSGHISMYAGGKTYELGPGQSARVSARTPHHLTVDEDDTRLRVHHHPPYNPETLYKVGWRKTETIPTDYL